MSLPEPWVDRIFTKLAVTYGEAFLRQYGAIDMAVVKANWGEELSGFQQHPDAIRHALEHLPPSKPPTVLEFRDLARRSPPKQLALTNDRAPADPAVAAKVRQAFTGRRTRPARAWAEALRARHQRGERLSQFQVDAYTQTLALGAEMPVEEVS